VQLVDGHGSPFLHVALCYSVPPTGVEPVVRPSGRPTLNHQA
jgi:hypothetical protein